MGCEGPNRGGVDGRCPSRAEFDALKGVFIATVDMAERARSEAATILLRRALALLRIREEEIAGRAACPVRDFRAS